MAALVVPGFDGPVVHTGVFGLATPIVQPKRGYRFGPENLVLGELVPEWTAATASAETIATPRVLDLGAGCGVLGLVAGAALARVGRVPARVVLVERNPELAAIARHNATAVDWPASVQEDDIRTFEAHEPFDVIVANPPFFAQGAGRPSSNPMVHGATHALHGGVGEFVAAAARNLAPNGLLTLVHPADSLADVLCVLAAHGLQAAELSVSDARHTGRPYRVWIGARWAVADGLEVRRSSVLTGR